MTSSFFGGTLYHYTLNIGLFILSMGLGSIAAEKIKDAEVFKFVIQIEAALFAVALSLPFYAVFAEKILPPSVFNALLWLTNIVLGLLSGLELPLFNRLLKGFDKTSEILFLDYLGMFCGSLAFSFLLFPLLGVFSALWVAAGLNLLVLVALLLLSGRLNRVLLSVSGVALVLTLYLIFSSDLLLSFLQKHYVT